VRTRKSAPVGIVYLLKRTELAVRSCAEALLTQFDLTPAQFLVLFQLNHATGVSGADLARAVGISPQSVVELIAPLERKGLIRRREDPEHRRILRMALTAAGERLFARAFPGAADLERELMINLTVPELAGLQKSLTKLLANAEAHESHPAMRRSTATAMARAARTRGKTPAAPAKRRSKSSR
jgi:DNA-binding MarR family transcriptional regulator